MQTQTKPQKAWSKSDTLIYRDRLKTDVLEFYDHPAMDFETVLKHKAKLCADSGIEEPKTSFQKWAVLYFSKHESLFMWLGIASIVGFIISVCVTAFASGQARTSNNASDLALAFLAWTGTFAAAMLCWCLYKLESLTLVHWATFPIYPWLEPEDYTVKKGCLVNVPPDVIALANQITQRASHLGLHGAVAKIEFPLCHKIPDPFLVIEYEGMDYYVKFFC